MLFRSSAVIKLKPDAEIKRVVICSGKVYYDLYEAREAQGINDVCLLRLEQLYPFAARALIHELGRFANADMVWCQEEPKNMGAWTSIEPGLEASMEQAGCIEPRPGYVGRQASASTATGQLSKHNSEQAEIGRAHV